MSGSLSAHLNVASRTSSGSSWSLSSVCSLLSLFYWLQFFFFFTIFPCVFLDCSHINGDAATRLNRKSGQKPQTDVSRRVLNEETVKFLLFVLCLLFFFLHIKLLLFVLDDKMFCVALPVLGV